MAIALVIGLIFAPFITSASVNTTARSVLLDYAPPRIDAAVIPLLPRKLKRNEELTFDALINNDGTVISIARVNKMDPIMEYIAKTTLQTWQFRPALFEDQPTIGLLRIKIDDYFYLREDPPDGTFQLPFSRALIPRECSDK